MAKAGLSGRAVAIWLLVVTSQVAGCAVPQATTAGGPLPGLHVVPGSLLLPAAPVAPPRVDTCGAAALAGLIGKPRTRIPVAVDLSRRRVACTACPVAPDVRLDRINILYDAKTGLVTRVTCG